MQYRIICVRDRVADCFGQPQFVVSIGGAIRSFGDEINREDKNNALFAHPADFDLYELGGFDDQQADWDLFDKPRQIAVGNDLKR